MIAELIAAVIVGGLALAFVLEPLLKARSFSPAGPVDPIDAEDTPRGLALAALKEIEFDRETGKLSDTDYEMLSTRYTAAAIEAMRAEERATVARVREPGGSERMAVASDAVEAVIAAKVRAIRAASSAQAAGGLSCPTCGPRPEPDAIFCSTCGSRLPTGAVCAGCRAPVPPDGSFCEVCGRKVAA
jgi:rRNA maturation endonuclease Nob1